MQSHAPSDRPRWRRVVTAIRRWFDNAAVDPSDLEAPDRVDWLRVLPFLALHLLCLGVIWVGWSWTAIGVAIGLYLLRMFAITGFYHRYFSHRAFKAGRAAQFVFAVLGSASAQRGPLWWAAHHRHHHRYSDMDQDRHSPHRSGFLWSHVGWFTARRNFPTDLKRVPDLARFPELRFLDRFDAIVPLLLIGTLYAVGEWLAATHPSLGTSGAQLLVWGFGVSTVVLFHATCSINSLAHVFGRRAYRTNDESRNSWILALITLGEGWHNNHHYYPGSARQGFRWWQVDLTYYGLKVLSWLRIVRDLRPVPEAVVRAGGRAR